MSIEHMRKMTLYAGISIILSAFVLTGCSHESSTIIGLHREPETVLADLSEWPQQEIIPNMPEIIQYDSGGLSVEIQTQEEYVTWIGQLEDYRSFNKLYMDMKETDVSVFLDEILAFGNFRTLGIYNGGRVTAKKINAVSMDTLEEIEFNKIHSIDEGLMSRIPRQAKLWIDMDGDYEGKPPELELLRGISCQNIMMVQRQGKGVETSVLMKEQNALETKLKEWSMIRTVLTEKKRVLCGYCSQVRGDYSYTEYEFCNSNTMDIMEAYICIKDQKSNGGQYFDVVSIPKERMENVLHAGWSRVWLEDMNFDGYTDIIFVGQGDGSPCECVYYLWDKAEKKYELDTTLPTRKLVNIDETRKRLTYSESASAFDDTYYIYQYDGERFREQKLWVVMDYLEQERKSIVTWQYYEDGKLMGKLEWILGDNEDISYVFYEENGERIEEVTINKKVYYDEIGLMYFPEFDFYNMG